MKSLDDLKKLREQAKKSLDMRNDSEKDYRVVVGMATCGIAAGARPVLNKLVEETSKNAYSCVVTQTGCIGLCRYEPIVEIYDKAGNKTTYVHVDENKAKEILESHVRDGKVLEEYVIKPETVKKAI